MRSRLRVLRVLRMHWGWGHLPLWRVWFRSLGEWRHYVLCPACGGSGEPYHAGGCEWCGGAAVWDLRERDGWTDEAQALLDAPTSRAIREGGGGA